MLLAGAGTEVLPSSSRFDDAWRVSRELRRGRPVGSFRSLSSLDDVVLDLRCRFAGRGAMDIYLIMVLCLCGLWTGTRTVLKIPVEDGATKKPRQATIHAVVMACGSANKSPCSFGG